MLPTDAALLLAVQMQQISKIFSECLGRVDHKLQSEVRGVQYHHSVRTWSAVSRRRSISRIRASLSNNHGPASVGSSSVCS